MLLGLPERNDEAPLRSAEEGTAEEALVRAKHGQRPLPGEAVVVC
jgi:hypothetical protein